MEVPVLKRFNNDGEYVTLSKVNVIVHSFFQRKNTRTHGSFYARKRQITRLRSNFKCPSLTLFYKKLKAAKPRGLNRILLFKFISDIFLGV